MSWNGNRVKDLRRRMGWSQGDLARRMNCDIAKVQDWESSNSEPESPHLRLLELLYRHADSYSDDVKSQAYADSVLDSGDFSQLDHHEIEGRLPSSDVE